jgi:hypothetical protein
MNDSGHVIAVEAARLVVDEGMDITSAKHKAARNLGRRSGRTGELPSNEAVEDEVRAHIEIFCADTQPAELRALRSLALSWMDRLEPLRPHLAGAAWRGTATRLSPLVIDLYCDDPKAAELALIDRRIDYDLGPQPAADDSRSVLRVASRCAALGETVTLHLVVHDLDELRGALRPDSRGRSWRGDAQALRRLLSEDPA